MYSEDELCQPKATLVFSSTLSAKLEDEWRLPGHCVGTRKVRAGSKLVLDVLKSEKRARREAHIASITRKICEDDGLNQPCVSAHSKVNLDADPDVHSFEMSNHHNEACKQRNKVTFKIMGENGVERRMTVKEKKEYKKILKKSQRDFTSFGKNDKQPPDGGELPPSSPTSSLKTDTMVLIKREYHQMTIDSQSLRAEIDQIRGERQGIMPIMLSQPLSRQFHYLQSLTEGLTVTRAETIPRTNFTRTKHFIQVDDSLALYWAQSLKRNLRFAEDIRSQEDLRPLAYTISPEVWVRLRPRMNSNQELQPWEYNTTSTHTISDNKDRNPWLFAWNRPPCTTTAADTEITLDETLSMIHSCLYHMAQSTDESTLKREIYISCGAKFGSDYLLYDGKRQNRHAFAGLRCIHKRKEIADPFLDGNLSWEDAHVEKVLPKLSPYDIAGFVRGLNTAGKLALVATVVTKRYYPSTCAQKSHEDDRSKVLVENGNPYFVHHIAIVDLALEKVLEAPTHLKKSSKHRKPRKDMGLNLDKAKK